MSGLTGDRVKSGLEQALGIIKLERDVIRTVADDESALPVGIAIVAVAGLLGWLPAFPVGLVLGPVVMLVVSFLMVGLMYGVGTLFGVTFDFMRLYRAVSHSWILGWAGIASVIPVIGQLVGMAIGIYQLVVAVVIVETLGPVDRGKAVAIVLLPTVVCGLLVVGGFMFGAAFLGMLGLEGLRMQ